jgi:DNA polymerase V
MDKKEGGNIGQESVHFEYEMVDLNQYVEGSKSVMGVQVVGGAPMEDADVYPGDLLIIDRSARPVAGSIIVAHVNGNLFVNHWRAERRLQLVGDNYQAQEREAVEKRGLLGVVTFTIRRAVFERTLEGGGS